LRTNHPKPTTRQLQNSKAFPALEAGSCFLVAAKPPNIKYLATGAISVLPSHSAFQYSRRSISCPELKFVFVFPDTERKETTITYLTTMKLKLNFKPELSL